MKINVIEYLEETTKKYPNKIALIDSNTQINFKDFYDSSLRISAHLSNNNLYSNNPIAIFLPKQIEALICIGGILLSGNIYMPLDIKSPKDRLQAILENIKPCYIITDKNNQEKLQDLFLEKNILLIENLLKNSHKDIKTNYQNLIDTDPAYIINTSGSTGTPKGVVVSHRSIIDYIEWILSEEKIKACFDDVIGNQSPFYFDNSVLDIYLCFFTGATLCLIPEEKFLFPKTLLEFISEKKINYIFWVPSLLSNIAKNKILDFIQPDLKTILFAGEMMPTRDLNYWIKRYPDTIFANLYGPTEITVDCSFYIIQRSFKDDELLPIGKSCKNTQIILLDENNQAIKSANKIGEICVRGSCLSLGYYNDLEKTQQCFIQNPLQHHYLEKIYKTGDLGYYNNFDELLTIGRKDFQIKHKGHRIELGEIETALGDFENIASLCVLYDTNKSQITLFYENKIEISKTSILEHLKNKLPKYMYPEKLVRLEALPLNANGKIDRKALAQTL